MMRNLLPASLVLLASVAYCAAIAAAPDSHVVALWLFDDPNYPGTTLTDAGPFKYDLRLVCGYSKWWMKTEGKGEPAEPPLHVSGNGGLVAGKYGSALRLPAGRNGSVEFPANVQRYGTAPLSPRDGFVPERFNIGYLDWSLEFWFKATDAQAEPGNIFELRNETGHRRAIPMVNALTIDNGRAQFLLSTRTVTQDAEKQHNLKLEIPTDAARLNDGAWHHVAFTYTAAETQIRHYVDGRLMRLPPRGGFLPMMGELVSFRIGDRFTGMLDEMRLSDVVRYKADFTPPGSFSQLHSASRQPNRPNGPPLLFPGATASKRPVAIGSRKHLFIDDALIESLTGLSFTVNRPVSVQVTSLVNDQPWEPTPRMGSTIPDVCSVWDDGGQIRMLYTNSGMWGGKPHAIGLATSKDGVKWDKPILNLESWEGSTRNNIVLCDSCQGAVIRDPNPAAPASERYKYAAWCFYRGFYVYTSPDGIHWKRNENCALPFDPDGSISLFWDDQRGIYRGFIRSLFESGDRRRTARVDIPDLLSPWPFKPADRPDIGDMDLARPVSGELPLIDTGGQVYRFKGHKYPWAPDAYFAFPWRFVADQNIRPGSFMMTSRNGAAWKIHEDPYYFAAGSQVEGRNTLEALMEHGMVRRGDEIWMFGTVRFTEHGGILYGGVEHDGGVHDRILKLVQRLDGFVSLDAAAGGGRFTTKPMVFEGNRLVLNIASRGTSSAALLGENGQPLPGFSAADCDPIRGDSIGRTVTWKGKSDVSTLAGRTVRVAIELKDAKLYALQFTSGGDNESAR
jgi:hypothetical protein